MRLPKLIALDIETKPKAKFKALDKAALIPHQNEITVIGVYGIFEDGTEFKKVFRTEFELASLYGSLTYSRPKLVGHNFKFDLRVLMYHMNNGEVDEHILDLWEGDTQLAAHIIPEAIPKEWLAKYESLREEVNSQIDGSHRKARGLSLKTLAPYHLGVEAFWEDPTNHDNDEYVLKDCEYTYKLWKLFTERDFKNNPNVEAFYTERQLPWAKNLLRMEFTGFEISDAAAFKDYEESVQAELKVVDEKLQKEWAPAYEAYERLKLNELSRHYETMADKAVVRLKDKTKEASTRARYSKLFEQAQQKQDFKLNLNSPDQLKWLLRDYYNHDLHTEVRNKDTGRIEIKESTGKEILNSLAANGAKDVELFLERRKLNKLATSYFPRYKELITDGKLYPFFNATGARTGRLSSQLPNMQQVPPSIRRFFLADIVRDYSALEPVLIAHFSQDKRLIDIINSGQSFHSVNAKEIFNLDCEEHEVKEKYPKHRDAAKEFGLSVLYGAGAMRVQKSLTKRGFEFTVDECKQFVYSLRDLYPGVWDFKQELDELLESGEVVYNYMGRPIHFEDPDDVYMKGFNTLIQGSGSDILQEAAYRIHKQIPALAISGLVHDELLGKIKKGLTPPRNWRKMVEEIMVNSFELDGVKLSVEGGNGPLWEK